MSSVVVKSADREEIESRVASLVEGWRREYPDIRQVIWFGSWVTGVPTPGSDVDFCIVLADSDKPMRERIMDFLPVGFPVGLDLIPFTETEFRDLPDRSPSLYEAIMGGRRML